MTILDTDCLSIFEREKYYDALLISRNLSDFQQVPQLSVEDWTV